MKIEKVKDRDLYRVRKQVDGQKISLYFGHKPTQREVLEELNNKIALQGSYPTEKGTIEHYVDKHLSKLKKDGISPSTIRGYQSIVNNTSAWFLRLHLNKVTQEHLQKLVDDYSVTHSPKSTRNLHGFYKSILGQYRPSFTYTIKLPSIEKKYEYEPSTKDIMAILEYAKGSRYSIFLQLSVLGLRRGEVSALTLEDLSDDNILTINKDMVVDENNVQVIKDTPKTSASNRRILIPESLADEIREQGFIFNGNMHTVNEYLHKVQDALEIPRFRLHILRHFSAAYLLKNGFTREQIFQFCGWEKGSQVMDRVYAYNLDPEDSQKEISNAFSGLF